MRKLYFLIFCLCIASVAYPQCKNSISLLKTEVKASGSQQTGTIQISVTSSDDYICTLSIEKGAGPEQIAKKKGQGTAVVKFDGLDISQIYKVEVEFLSDKSYCRKLQKSQITFYEE